MQFRLTYAGVLLGASRSNTRANHKHDLRKHFHKQLARLWRQSALLSEKKYGSWDALDFDNPNPKPERLYIDVLKERFALGSYEFAPIVTEELSLSFSLDILFLRPGPEGRHMQSGDIDNRLKTIFDSLRRPQNNDELAGGHPDENEKPFFCLLEDERLVTRVAVETDSLLEPIGNSFNDNDARLVIDVRIHPHSTNFENMDFIGN